jgi:hypothetical protein
VENQLEPLESAIRNHLAAYLAGELSLDQFTDWFVGASWNIDKSESPSAYELAAGIELALAEASSGLLSREDLQAELINLAANTRIGVKMVHGVEVH